MQLGVEQLCRRPAYADATEAALVRLVVGLRAITPPLFVIRRRSSDGASAGACVGPSGDTATSSARSGPLLCSTLRILSSVNERGCNSMVQGSRKFLDISVGSG